MEDQHKEPEKEQEGEPTDHRKEEEEEEAAGNPGEVTDQRKEGEAEVDKSEEPTGQRKEEPEVDKSEELTDQRKAEAEEEKEKGTERSSDQESMEDSSPFVHPCSRLLQYLARACAWCLGMPDPFDDGGSGTRPSPAPAAPLNSSREVGVAAVNKARDSTGVYYMQEVITRVWVRLRRPRPGGNPREGPGGNGGVHH